MCKTSEKVIYWLTLVGPILDAVKGVVLGLVSAYRSVKAEREALELQEKNRKMQELFDNDNSQTYL